jgi:hypothetical protein
VSIAQGYIPARRVPPKEWEIGAFAVALIFGVPMTMLGTWVVFRHWDEIGASGVVFLLASSVPWMALLGAGFFLRQRRKSLERAREASLTRLFGNG